MGGTHAGLFSAANSVLAQMSNPSWSQLERHYHSHMQILIHAVNGSLLPRFTSNAAIRPPHHHPPRCLANDLSLMLKYKMYKLKVRTGADGTHSMASPEHETDGEIFSTGTMTASSAISRCAYSAIRGSTSSPPLRSPGLRFVNMAAGDANPFQLRPHTRGIVHNRIQQTVWIQGDNVHQTCSHLFNKN